ncbi:type VI secretion system-associated protein TagF [Roseibaca sp. V10]|uniref:Type VI secretion system-associated protein TagF n=1 Tax=Roseinatronobacter domitianus TaxID=2940293 RepID=A0ABT0M2U2_9RHOB|nr:type VI secretion system-associated protein TagF [Roseibaca domitiana]MCL1629174.1 type VI secretion system-associated protein TagF [Roseibaca domitiana]
MDDTKKTGPATTATETAEHAASEVEPLNNQNDTLVGADETPSAEDGPETAPPSGAKDDAGDDEGDDEGDSSAPILEKTVDEDPAAPLDTEPPATPDPDTDALSDTPSPETLPPRASAQVGLFGKLPMRGDFITRQMPSSLSRPFEDWLIPLVQDTRATLGADWSRIWHSAGAWNFWLGGDVFQGSWQKDMRGGSGFAGASMGVLQPSADKHGRDFPIVLLLADSQSRIVPPPVVSPPDTEWYVMCQQFVHRARADQDMTRLEAALAALPAPRVPLGAEDMAPLLESRALWAEGSGDVWNDIARADHQLAAGSRSYWWQDGGSVLSLVGLPDADTFAFMLSHGQPAPATAGPDADGSAHP